VRKSLGISIKIGRILQDWVMFSMGSADFHGGFHGESLSYTKMVVITPPEMVPRCPYVCINPLLNHGFGRVFEY